MNNTIKFGPRTMILSGNEESVVAAYDIIYHVRNAVIDQFPSEKGKEIGYMRDVIRVMTALGYLSVEQNTDIDDFGCVINTEDKSLPKCIGLYDDIVYFSKQGLELLVPSIFTEIYKDSSNSQEIEEFLKKLEFDL